MPSPETNKAHARRRAASTHKHQTKPYAREPSRSCSASSDPSSYSSDSPSSGSASPDDSLTLLYPADNPRLSTPHASPARPLSPPADLPGFPTFAQYKRIETTYLASLSERKQFKALISQDLFDSIWDVLHGAGGTALAGTTAQFRFWVRKMFELSYPQTAFAQPHDATPPRQVIVHDSRPVAVKEQLYEILCYCHGQCGHGGRDKTCGAIRALYSWVPKELTAQFVKACPTCTLKRSGNPELVNNLIQDRISLSLAAKSQSEENSPSLEDYLGVAHFGFGLNDPAPAPVQLELSHFELPSPNLKDASFAALKCSPEVIASYSTRLIFDRPSAQDLSPPLSDTRPLERVSADLGYTSPGTVPLSQSLNLASSTDLNARPCYTIDFLPDGMQYSMGSPGLPYSPDRVQLPSIRELELDLPPGPHPRFIRGQSHLVNGLALGLSLPNDAGVKLAPVQSPPFPMQSSRHSAGPSTDDLLDQHHETSPERKASDNLDVDPKLLSKHATLSTSRLLADAAQMRTTVDGVLAKRAAEQDEQEAAKDNAARDALAESPSLRTAHRTSPSPPLSRSLRRANAPTHLNLNLNTNPDVFLFRSGAASPLAPSPLSALTYASSVSGEPSPLTPAYKPGAHDAALCAGAGALALGADVDGSALGPQGWNPCREWLHEGAFEDVELAVGAEGKRGTVSERDITEAA